MKLSKKKLLLIAGIAITVIIGAGAAYTLTHSGLGVDRNNLPKFIQANFIDLNKIYSISKFRSGEGHDFSGNGETCRSMKHYFTPQYDPAAETYRKEHNGLTPPPDGSDADIAVYSPFDGTLVGADEEQTPIGKQLRLVADTNPDFVVRIFHVYLKEGIVPGTKIKAGQRIGSLGKSQSTDVSVQIGQLPWGEEYVSVFQVMSDNVFNQYQARGVSTRNDLIITKEYRDAHPIPCEGRPEQKFIYPQGYDATQDNVYLSGYDASLKQKYQPKPTDANKVPVN